MSGQPGLRERKKLQTHSSIMQAAFELFAEFGFESVTVAEVAQRADVSPATVFNYFAAKEDLVYGTANAFYADLLSSMENRPPGTTVINQFRIYLMQQRPLGRTAEEEAHQRTLIKIITGSPDLLARERDLTHQAVQALAQLLAEESNAVEGDITPWVVANALMGVHQAVVEYTRQQVLEGVSGSTLTRRVRSRASRALTMLGEGLNTGDVSSVS